MCDLHGLVSDLHAVVSKAPDYRVASRHLLNFIRHPGERVVEFRPVSIIENAGDLVPAMTELALQSLNIIRDSIISLRISLLPVLQYAEQVRLVVAALVKQLLG
jgi:hypothetical protein